MMIVLTTRKKWAFELVIIIKNQLLIEVEVEGYNGNYLWIVFATFLLKIYPCRL